VDVISSESAYLGEGPRYDSNREEVIWVDIMAGILRRSVLTEGALQTRHTYELAIPVGAAAPMADGDGWVLAAGTGFHHLAEDGTLTLIAEAEAGRADDVRMNDATCDPHGRMLAGSMAWDEHIGGGKLFSLDTGSVTMLRPSTTVSNGLAWSADGTTLWWADSGAGEIRQFGYDLDTGAIDAGTPFVTIPPDEGCPDGLAIDDDGCLWVGIWGGHAVRRYAPDARLLEEIALPVSHVTAPCFIGSTLIITSARKALSPEQLAQEPLAGHVFAVEVDVTGPPVRAYGKPSIT
jgi:sugar lactone lactonase YvrE